jgi:hypothetical protein
MQAAHRQGRAEQVSVKFAATLALTAGIAHAAVPYCMAEAKPRTMRPFSASPGCSCGWPKYSTSRHRSMHSCLAPSLRVTCRGQRPVRHITHAIRQVCLSPGLEPVAGAQESCPRCRPNPNFPTPSRALHGPARPCHALQPTQPTQTLLGTAAAATPSRRSGRQKGPGPEEKHAQAKGSGGHAARTSL